jgi:hypothetical protein
MFRTDTLARDSRNLRVLRAVFSSCLRFHSCDSALAGTHEPQRSSGQTPAPRLAFDVRRWAFDVGRSLCLPTDNLPRDSRKLRGPRAVFSSCLPFHSRDSALAETHEPQRSSGQTPAPRLAFDVRRWAFDVGRSLCLPTDTLPRDSRKLRGLRAVFSSCLPSCASWLRGESIFRKTER